MRKIAVVFFCLVGGGLSIYYVCKAVTGKEDRYHAGEIKTFHLPKTMNSKETETLSDVLIDEETWNKVQAFRKYIDSLKTANSPDYYIIMDARPGLMDSITTLEQIYYSQKLK